MKLVGIDGNEANVRFRVGAGQYAYGVISELYKQKDSEFVVYLKEQPLPDMPGKKRSFDYKVFGPKRFWTRFALPIHLFLNHKKPSVFFTPGHYAPFVCPCPMVISIMDLSYLRYPTYFKKTDLAQLTNWTKRSVSLAKKILTISEFSKKEIVDYYKIDPERVVVTYPGYDESFIKIRDENKIEEVKNNYKINGRYILYVGTLQPRKNVERLIDAYAVLRKEGVEEKLVLAGKKGWLYETIMTKAESLGIADSVVFTGFVKQADLPYIINGASVYVLPSLYEGFGIPVVEAMACGVPVVVSNTSSLPEVVGEAGVLVNPEDVSSIAEGIRKILSDGLLREKMVNLGMKLKRRYNWKECGEKTYKVLMEV